MPHIRVPDTLWQTSLMPEGILERWLVLEGSDVVAGEALACIRIHEALHEVLAPASGRIVALSSVNSVVEPGSPIAELVQ